MVFRERTVSIRSVLQRWSGSGSKRDCSSVKASAQQRDASVFHPDCTTTVRNFSLALVDLVDPHVAQRREAPPGFPALQIAQVDGPHGALGQAHPARHLAGGG